MSAGLAVICNQEGGIGNQKRALIYEPSVCIPFFLIIAKSRLYILKSYLTRKKPKMFVCLFTCLFVCSFIYFVIFFNSLLLLDIPIYTDTYIHCLPSKENL